MTLREVLDACKGLNVFEERCVSDEAVQLIFFSKDTSEWTSKLTGVLGAAVKPAGRAPTPEDRTVAKPYGGVMEDQALFKKDFADSVIVALLWPWQDNEHTTLKMYCVKK